VLNTVEVLIFGAPGFVVTGLDATEGIYIIYNINKNNKYTTPRYQEETDFLGNIQYIILV
jgi:hypothetical protein